jgi:hypothetical protein
MLILKNLPPRGNCLPGKNATLWRNHLFSISANGEESSKLLVVLIPPAPLSYDRLNPYHSSYHADSTGTLVAPCPTASRGSDCCNLDLGSVSRSHIAYLVFALTRLARLSALCVSLIAPVIILGRPFRSPIRLRKCFETLRGEGK